MSEMINYSLLSETLVFFSLREKNLVHEQIRLLLLTVSVDRHAESASKGDVAGPPHKQYTTGKEPVNLGSMGLLMGTR